MISVTIAAMQTTRLRRSCFERVVIAISSPWLQATQEGPGGEGSHRRPASQVRFCLAARAEENPSQDDSFRRARAASSGDGR